MHGSSFACQYACNDSIWNNTSYIECLHAIYVDHTHYNFYIYACTVLDSILIVCMILI